MLQSKKYVVKLERLKEYEQVIKQDYITSLEGYSQ